jgi:hypothetical protein
VFYGTQSWRLVAHASTIVAAAASITKGIKFPRSNVFDRNEQTRPGDSPPPPYTPVHD